MQSNITLVQITNYTSPNCTDRPQVNIHCIENFFTVPDFWATCVRPEKQSCPDIFHCILTCIFIIKDFWKLVLALKTEFPLKFFTVLNILFTFWILSKLHALALKNRVALIFFTVFEHSAIFVKPQQWPTPSESIAINCDRFACCGSLLWLYKYCWMIRTSWIIARRWEQNQAGDTSNSRLKSSRRFLLQLYLVCCFSVCHLPVLSAFIYNTCCVIMRHD